MNPSHIKTIPATPPRPEESWKGHQIQNEAFLREMKREHDELAQMQVPDREIIGILPMEE